MSVLSLQNLSIAYLHQEGPLPAVKNVSFDLEEGETLALVGESGCGKTSLGLSIMGLLPAQKTIQSGAVFFQGKNILEESQQRLRLLRGAQIGMVFQDPFTALNPVLPIRLQLEEAFAWTDSSFRNADVKETALRALLEQVQLREPDRILKSYPHQLSGGQRQRVVIAMAIARRPALLIADEPTTALDVTIQDEIVRLLKHLSASLRMAMIFITHNIALVNSVADRLGVMYAGELVEHGPTGEVLKSPKHPYTAALLRSLPSVRSAGHRLAVLEGQPPALDKRPPGCVFHPRCEKIFSPCQSEDPPHAVVGGVSVKCHLYKGTP